LLSLYFIANDKISKQKNNSKDVSKISIKSLPHKTAYNVYEKLLTTQRIQELILKSFDFFVFINFIVWGKYEIIVHNDTIPNNIFPNIYTSPLQITIYQLVLFD
jgi:hypothetical protein